MNLAEVKNFANQIQHDSTRKTFEVLLEYIDKLETAVFRLEIIVIDTLLEQAINTDYGETAEEVEEETDAIPFGEPEGVSEDQSSEDLPEMEIGAWSGNLSSRKKKKKKNLS